MKHLIPLTTLLLLTCLILSMMPVPVYAITDWLYENFTLLEGPSFTIFNTNPYAINFTTNTTHYIDKIQLLIYRVGLPGTATLKIMTTNASGYPDTSIAEANIDGNTLTTSTNGVWADFNYSTAAQVSNNTLYALSLWSLGANSSNAVKWRAATDYGYFKSSDNGVTWVSYTTNTGNFKIYGFDSADPVMGNLTATNITATTATLGVNVSSLGTLSNADLSFEYGATTDYGLTSGTQTINATGIYIQGVTGLINNGSYHYRAKLSNAGTWYSNDSTFTTLSGVANVSTNLATGVNMTQATLNGQITNLNGMASATGRGFVWAASSYGDPGNLAPSATSYASYWSQTGTYSTGTFNHTATSLASNTTYYVRAAVQTTAGWAYGSERSFTTATRYLLYQPSAIINGNTLPDETGKGNPATITWGANPGSMPTSVDGPYPVNTPTPTPTYTPGPTTYPTGGPNAPPTITNTPPGFFNPPATPPFPGGSLPGEIEDSSGLPSIFWFVFPLIIILVIGIVIHDKTKSLAAQFGIMAICMLFVGLFHIWPLWMIVPFAFTGGACVMAGKVWSY